ncbi:ParA family protein [Dermatobacter hominis]|uniref:ParA family protein n=1 Tax=Dermatobacter hominis TaxID=2884263 RepID=UPI002868A006|nr:AAA family ATPase [Dermatobacter hominis]
MSDLPPDTGANDGSVALGAQEPSDGDPIGVTGPTVVPGAEGVEEPADGPGDRSVAGGDEPATGPIVDLSDSVSPAAAVDAPSDRPSGDGAEPGTQRVPDLSEAGSPEVASGPSGVSGRPLPRVIAIANQKGGVGKTTTTVNMGAALAELDHRTLVIDLDPQGNATTGLGINYRTLDHTMYDVLLHDVPLEDCIEPTEVRNLFVAPASLDLAGAEIELVPAFSREGRLKRAIAEIIDDYDFILIDCPPSLGLLTVNGLVAATEVMVPIQCEYYALEGLAQLTRNVDLVRTNLNPELEISGIVLVMYDSRTRLAEQVVTEVRAHFGPKVCRNMIPRNIRLSEAPSFGQPITTFDPSSRGAVAYRELAREVSGGS